MEKDKCEKCGNIVETQQKIWIRTKNVCRRCFNLISKENRELHRSGKDIPKTMGRK